MAASFCGRGGFVLCGICVLLFFSFGEQSTSHHNISPRTLITINTSHIGAFQFPFYHLLIQLYLYIKVVGMSNEMLELKDEKTLYSALSVIILYIKARPYFLRLWKKYISNIHHMWSKMRWILDTLTLFFPNLPHCLCRKKRLPTKSTVVWSQTEAVPSSGVAAKRGPSELISFTCIPLGRSQGRLADKGTHSSFKKKKKRSFHHSLKNVYQR